VTLGGRIGHCRQMGDLSILHQLERPFHVAAKKTDESKDFGRVAFLYYDIAKFLIEAMNLDMVKYTVE
jgi:hypothetical protein